MITMVIRTLIVYLFLLTAIRMMGKRQIGELQLSELVTTLLLSELAAQPITDSEIPLCNAVIPILLLLSTEIILSFFVTKSSFLKRLLNGTPSILISDGKLNIKELKKTRLSVEELLAEIRLKNLSGFDAVNYAILEQNGKISIFPKVGEDVVKNANMGLDVQETGISHVLISDGKISRFNQQLLKLSDEDVKKILKKNHLKTAKDAFILSMDDAGQIYLAKKEN